MSRLQLCPAGYLCHRPGCRSPAIVADASDREDTYCADHGADSYGIDELYAVTRNTDAAGEVLGVALDGFANGVRWAQEANEYEASTPALREGNGR